MESGACDRSQSGTDKKASGRMAARLVYGHSDTWGAPSSRQGLATRASGAAVRLKTPDRKQSLVFSVKA